MSNRNKDVDSERLFKHWDYYGHKIAVWPGIVIAYLAGMFSDGDMNFLVLIAMIIGVEAISFLVAFIVSKRAGGSAE